MQEIKIMKTKVLDNIIDLFARRAGISPTALNIQVWESVLADRMKKTRITREWDYFDKLMSTPIELQHFFDRIVVLETWFFRDAQAFNYLASYAFNEWYPKMKDQGTMNLLSVPCSTGEEPYSMAISLLRAGFPARMFAIDAIDISPTAIAIAELGIYGRNSFRGKDRIDVSPYFTTVDEGLKIKSTVHDQVSFRTANVFDYGFLSTKPKYDVIFCRNLLIYLHPEAQNQLLRIMSRLLAPHGVIFVGATEGELLRKFGFVASPAPKAAAFYNTKRENSFAKRVVQFVDSPANPPVETIKPPKDLFHKAKEFADQGQFEEATSECLNVLQENGPSAEGYFLLGVIMHAADRNERAEEFFKKALYLDPDYHEALVYMVLLAEARGGFEEAQRYRERAARAEGAKAGKS